MRWVALKYGILTVKSPVIFLKCFFEFVFKISRLAFEGAFRWKFRREGFRLKKVFTDCIRSEVVSKCSSWRHVLGSILEKLRFENLFPLFSSLFFFLSFSCYCCLVLNVNFFPYILFSLLAYFPFFLLLAVSLCCTYSRLPITRTFKGNRKKVRVIGSSSYREFEENSRE